ncbi:MAG: hypothetical protein R3F42_07650 [Pseudomonadota bacterium]
MVEVQESVKITLALLILLARIGDIGSTWLASPRLELESNTLIRRLHWPFALLTIGVFIIPWWDVGAGIVIMVASWLVAASNSSKLWLIRAMGESEYRMLLSRMAAGARPLPSVIFSLMPAGFMCALGATVMYLYPDETTDYGYHVGLGIVGYALVVAIYGPLTFLRYRQLGLAERRQHGVQAQ